MSTPKTVAENDVFRIGDHVRFVRNLYFTSSADRNIGKTGVIEQLGYVGTLQNYLIRYDEPQEDKFGISTGFIAHFGEIEHVKE